MENNNYKDIRLKKIAQLVQGKKVLDIGFAQSPNPHLADFDVVGYDLNKSDDEAVLDIYKQQIQADVKDISSVLQGFVFDTIICGELIEHLEDPYQFLRDLKSLMTAASVLLLTTPNPLTPTVLPFEIVGSKKYFFTSEHTYYFLPRWVERLLERSGFELIKKYSIGFGYPFFRLPSPIWMSYQIIYKAKLKK